MISKVYWFAVRSSANFHASSKSAYVVNTPFPPSKSTLLVSVDSFVLLSRATASSAAIPSKRVATIIINNNCQIL